MLLNIIPDIKLFSQLIHAVRQVSGKLKTALTLTALSSICQGLAYTCFYPLFRALEPRGGTDEISKWLLIALFLVILSALLRWIGQNYDYNGHSAQAQYHLRKQLGDKLREIPLETLARKRAGQWGAIISNNVDEVTLFIFTIVSVIMYGIITPLTVGLATLFFDWKIGLVILIIFPAVIPFYRWRKPAYDRGMQYLDEAHAELNAESIEYVQGLAVLKATNGVEKIVKRLDDTIDKVEQVQVYGHTKGSGPNLIIASALETGVLITLGLGVLLVLYGNSEAIIMAALMIIVIRFSELISSFVPMTMFFSLMEVGIKNMRKMMDIAPLKEVAPSIRGYGDEINFNGVYFRYEDSDSWVLEDINLTIPKRSIVALVGPSGSGKTTLTRMLMRYADIQQGELSIGGQDIRSYKISELLNKVSVVFQDVYLFDDTIEQNIKMAKPEASRLEVIEAATKAHCHDFIMELPLGYETPLGEMGNSLSGGEKQRISIARALLKNTPIVILDEPTSSLDSLNELAIQKAIDELVKEKIVIVIAHRLSTIIGADLICVMDDGKIVEQGDHEALMLQKGKYYDLWNTENRMAHYK